MSHALDGARERLKRAKENIQNLNREICAFLAPAPTVTMPVDMAAGKPIITDEDRKSFEELKEFIRSTTIDPRFKVLTGEIIHHFRCAFDHVAWQLSSPDFQEDPSAQLRIEFPVFRQEPELCGIRKNKISLYCRKIQGISSPTALARIDALQPHRRMNPSRDPLWIIHDMDRIDKHRELLLVAFTGLLNISASANIPAVGELMPWETKPRNVRPVGPPNVQMEVQMTAQVSLNEFTKREDQPIVPTLQNLLRFTVDAVESFAEEFT